MLFAVALILSFGIQRLKTEKFDFNMFVRKHLPSALYAYFQTISLCYKLILSTLLEPLLCTAQLDGIFVMLRNQSVTCYTDHWKHAVLPYMLPLAVLYCAILPVLFYSNRNNMNSPEFQKYFGFLINSYRSETYWSEFILVLKKALFLLVPEFVALKFSSSMKLFSSIIILIVFQIHLQYFQPYAQQILNRLSQQ